MHIKASVEPDGSVSKDKIQRMMAILNSLKRIWDFVWIYSERDIIEVSWIFMHKYENVHSKPVEGYSKDSFTTTAGCYFYRCFYLFSLPFVNVLIPIESNFI